MSQSALLFLALALLALALALALTRALCLQHATVGCLRSICRCPWRQASDIVLGSAFELQEQHAALVYLPPEAAFVCPEVRTCSGPY